MKNRKCFGSFPQPPKSVFLKLNFFLLKTFWFSVLQNNTGKLQMKTFNKKFLLGNSHFLLKKCWWTLFNQLYKHGPTLGKVWGAFPSAPPPTPKKAVYVDSREVQFKVQMTSNSLSHGLPLMLSLPSRKAAPPPAGPSCCACLSPWGATHSSPGLQGHLTGGSASCCIGEGEGKGCVLHARTHTFKPFSILLQRD